MASTSEMNPKYETKMLIGGELKEGEGEALKIYNPSTGQVIAEIKEASAEQVNRAVEAAHHAFPAWSQLSAKDRSVALLSIADTIEANSELLARLESDNCGKPFTLALTDELPAIVDTFRFFAGACRSLPGLAAG